MFYSLKIEPDASMEEKVRLFFKVYMTRNFFINLLARAFKVIKKWRLFSLG